MTLRVLVFIIKTDFYSYHEHTIARDRYLIDTPHDIDILLNRSKILPM